ncbi:MAG: hypothetical protein AB8I08_29595 [Sandaracinaceae bacterium]
MPPALLLVALTLLPAAARAQTPGRALTAPMAPQVPVRFEDGVAPVAAPYLPAQAPMRLVPNAHRARTASLLVERLRQPQPLAALSTAERAAYSGAMMQSGDPSLTRDLLRSVSRLQHPDREPGWSWAGMALSIGGGAGLGSTLVAWFFDSFGGADDSAYIGGVAALGATLATGLALLLVGAIINRWAPQQSAFRRRQSDVRRALRSQYREQRRAGVGPVWPR